MAEIVFEVKNRKRVVTDSVVAFVRDLLSEGYLFDDGIQWLGYDHYVPELNARTGESFKPKSVAEAEGLIREHGVEYLSIGFGYVNLYERAGDRGIGVESTLNKLAVMVDKLNAVMGQLAAEFNQDVSIDIYHSASFRNGNYYNEYVEGGFQEECKLTLGGDGWPDWDNLDKYNERFAQLAEESDEYRQFKQLLEKHFGGISVYVGASEM